MTKFETIVDNNINGNISHCKSLTKNMSKYEMLELIEFWKEYTGENTDSVITHLRVIV